MSNFVVLDASESVAGQYCCRLFADFGADVTLIEPPSGSALRRSPPFDPASDGAGSLLFFRLNLGKRSVVLDLTTSAGCDRLCELARQTDVVVAGSGCDAQRLQGSNPQGVIAVVSDFDPASPYGGWRGSEMVFQTFSGMMYNNGERGREPLYGVGHRASYAAGVGAYISVMAALYARPHLGAGQVVKLDVAHYTAAMAPPAAMMFLYSGLLEARGQRSAPFTMLCCKGGWLGVWIYQHLYKPLCESLDRQDLLSNNRFAADAGRMRYPSACVTAVSLQRHTRLSAPGVPGSGRRHSLCVARDRRHESRGHRVVGSRRRDIDPREHHLRTVHRGLRS